MTTTAPLATVYIGLGSNLENPVFQIQIALKQLQTLPEISFIECSQSYGSTPLGPEDQPDFVNAVCRLKTSLSPRELLVALQKIEFEQGRIKRRHWGERLIDLDILQYNDIEMSSADLTIPHAEMAKRDFVLIPLAELSPGLVIPGLGTVESLIAGLESSYLKSLTPKPTAYE